MFAESKSSFFASFAAASYREPRPKSDQQYAWGNYTWSLSGGNPLEGFSRKYDGGFVEIELLNELPMLQHTGRKLDTITLKGRWFARDAQRHIDALEKVRNEGKPRTLVRGDGTSLGQFVLREFDASGEQMIHNGTCMVQDVTIQLCEFGNKTQGKRP